MHYANVAKDIFHLILLNIFPYKNENVSILTLSILEGHVKIHFTYPYTVRKDVLKNKNIHTLIFSK